MTALAWVTFGLALVLALVRIPSAMRGENRLMMALFALIALAILLSIKAPYLAIDETLGGINLANLLLRFLIYAITLLLAVRVALAFSARSAHQALLGPWGLAALAFVGAATVLSFLLMGLFPSSVGLGAGDRANPGWFDVYSELGRVYPGFTGVILLPSLLRALRVSALVALRAAAGLLAAGYAMLALTIIFPLMPDDWVAARQAMNYSSLLFLLTGLATIWIASLTARRRAETS
jgi:hypothetical protein